MPRYDDGLTVLESGMGPYQVQFDVLDVAGDSRKTLQVEDLIAMFRKMRGQTLDDDALLIG